ncbi:MAG: carbohydrate ABC transporter permease [Thermotogae bacterium]|uniref:Carbohydrate ABC transporter permease n=1 Tax=Kosmotoga arenicorallina TaxID=688066 RepID=A0A7C5DVG8_9BACT|nr:carbohydrate ABC transporter permease [Kosmotoga sp.]MCD6159039.1 carbohydrate ABC transporter permease [Kosmotoga sp.]RKX50925.1 MAG: carbohydrate ABC transporter permease [Thermotogota bacterium]HHF08481.1 carbohydrate ABC transporter permease [Kosmotoga arenicorallina]
MPAEKSRKKLTLIDKSISYTLMILLAIFFLFPLIYMISTSLNPDELDILKRMGSIKAFIPSPASLKNYSDVFARMPFGRFIFNSVLIVSLTVLAGLLVNSMMAFGLARFTFKGRGLLVSIIVALMIIPFETIAVPLLLMTNKFGWLDSYHVQIIPFIANPFYIFLFYQFFISFPKALEEAALIDGASWFKIYWKIALPLSKPILASVAILHFLMQWGFFLWPLMVTRGPEYRPLPVAMQVFFGQYPRDWGDIMAFATMMTAPVLILFVVLQGQYVKSVSQTGIK